MSLWLSAEPGDGLGGGSEGEWTTVRALAVHVGSRQSDLNVDHKKWSLERILVC